MTRVPRRNSALPLPSPDDTLELARLVSRIERDPLILFEILPEGHRPHSEAARVGVTGSTGVGKSTLISELLKPLSRSFASIAVVSVDPTSPTGGGALLGDRVRSVEKGLPDGVFFRSVASRGAVGGLSPATAAICRLLEEVGFELILIETVGSGQVSFDVDRLVDLLVLVVSPEGGDDVQAMKSGLNELADLFVVNKSDRPGAERTVRSLRAELNSSQPEAEPERMIIKASASEGEGCTEVAELMVEELEALPPDRLSSAALEQFEFELHSYLRSEVEKRFSSPELEAKLHEQAEKIASGKLSLSDGLKSSEHFLNELRRTDD